MNIQRISYDDFIRHYEPTQNHLNKHAAFDGCMFETFSKELAYIQAAKPECIWTLIEHDEGLSITSGFHFVNRLGYFISSIPCPADVDIEISVSTHWDSAEDYAEQYLEDNPEDRKVIAQWCEEQGILAAAVCFHLMRQGKEEAARRFINDMIGSVAE